MTPEAPPGAALNTIEARISGGLLALNRFLMTLQNKRMPVDRLTLGRDRRGLRAVILLDCPAESARRYTTLLSGLEDVEGIEAARETLEVALVAFSGEPSGERWREPAARLGIAAHENGGTVVASGEPERVEAWLSEVEGEVQDVVRLGPVARPGIGGG